MLSPTERNQSSSNWSRQEDSLVKLCAFNSSSRSPASSAPDGFGTKLPGWEGKASSGGQGKAAAKYAEAVHAWSRTGHCAISKFS